MIKVAVFSPDERRSAKLTSALKAEGFEVQVLPEDALPARSTAPIDLFLIDAVDARKGAEILVKAGELTGTTIAIIGPERLTDKGLGQIDDFLVEPYGEDEFKARVKRLLPKETLQRITFGALTIKPDSYEALIEDRPIDLTYKEFALLKLLAANPERVWTRDALLNRIWDYDFYGGTRTVDVHIRRLRSKLGTRYGSLIKTVRQVGYKFNVSD